MDSSDALLPGAKAGPWCVERELGRGGMGAVYAVVHDEIGKRAALKVVHKRLLVPGFNADRMLLEARVVNQVGHPNIVDIFETGTLPDHRPYIVMERLEGKALSQRADEGKLLADLVVGILLQVCDALIAAHAAGIVHRDLKLDNVFLVDNPDDPYMPKVKLLDWGIAKVLAHDVKHTIEGQLVGTPQYLSPEQARGLEVSGQTDVYSLGVMAYELFLEQLPFEAETAAEVMAMHLRAVPPPPSDLWPDVPPALEDLLLAMLAKQPDQRPTMIEVVRRLTVVREDLDARRRIRRPGSISTPVGTPIEPGPGRAISSAGLANTEPAMLRAGTKRWQYTLGASALVASALLFWISRDGDRAASAATNDHAPIVEAAPALDIALPDAPPRAPVAARVIAVEARAIASSIDSRGPRVVDATSAPSVVTDHAAPVAPTRRAVPANRPRVTPRASARPAPHASPAAPRRGTKVDPDGTIDPYQ